MAARIMAVGSLKGGTGKTTLAMNLASALSTGRRVVLVDADAQASATDWAATGSLPFKVISEPLEDQQAAKAWIGKVRGLDADLVVIDLPPQIGDAVTAAFIIADLALIPVAPSPLDLRAAGKILELLRLARAERGDGLPNALLIPSKVDRRTAAGREAEAALHELGEPVAPAIGLRTAFVDSATAGTWVGAFAAKTAAHVEVEALAAIIKRKLA